MYLQPTVFVVDEDQSIRDAVRHLVHTMNLRCETYATGPEFLDNCDPSRPGCVVLEVRVPGASGIEIQNRLSSQEPSRPVIFLSSEPALSIAVRAMRAGAIHFMEKPARETELWETIQEAIRLDHQRRRRWHRQKEIERCLERLTPGERELVRGIIGGKTNKTMALECGVSLRTIEQRRARIMKKLKVGSLTELLHLVLVGYNGHLDNLTGQINGRGEYFRSPAPAWPWHDGVVECRADREA